jgi:hypothetical protein
MLLAIADRVCRERTRDRFVRGRARPSLTIDPLPSPSILSIGLSMTSPKLLPIVCRRFSIVLATTSR